MAATTFFVCQLAVASLYIVLTVGSVKVAKDQSESYKDYMDYIQDTSQGHSRSKRSPGAGFESCLQMYTVPKRTVQCEPSPEVQQELTTFKDSLSAQVTALGELKTQLDNLDPDKPRPLPAEVKERLETIITVRETQAAHTEVFNRLEQRIQHLSDRIGQIESADRHQVAQLIEEQTRLIKVTLHQSNMSLHDEYVDRLTQSTRDLTDRLRHLEDNLNTKIEETEEKLEQAVEQAEMKARQNLGQTKTDLDTRLQQFNDGLNTETSARSNYQLKTDENTGELEKLLALLTTLREHQATYEQDKDKLREVIAGLSASLQQEQDTNMLLRQQVSKLNESLSSSQSQFEQFMQEVSACNNRSESLQEHLQNIEGKVHDKQHLMPRLLKVSDCRDALAFFYPTTGVYPVNPGQAGDPFEVYCDMEDGEGWTVLMRRQDGSTDFYRGWEAYEEGFGQLGGEHWLGLDKIHALTSRKHYKLRIDLQDWNRNWWYAEYDKFEIGNEDSGYKLHVDGYHGNAGDSLHFHQGMGFSTHDRSHDINDGICARWCHGAWWYRDCFTANLNGRYYNTGVYTTTTGWGDGVVWRALKGTNFYSVKAVVMKITPFKKTSGENMKNDA